MIPKDDHSPLFRGAEKGIKDDFYSKEEPNNFNNIVSTILADSSHLFKKNKSFDILSKRVGSRIIDILFEIPQSFYNRRFIKKINDINNDGEYITMMVKVLEHLPPGSKKSPYKILVQDEYGDTLSINYFYSHNPQYYKSFPSRFFIGRKMLISGKVKFNNKNFEIHHPDKVGSILNKEEWTGIQNTYSLSRGLFHSNLVEIIHKCIGECLCFIDKIEEWIPSHIINEKKWPSFFDAIKIVHKYYPFNSINTESEIDLYNKSFERLLFDEALSHQISTIICKNSIKKLDGCKVPINIDITDSFIKSLPFHLTNGQKNSLKDIFFDMNSKKQMVRLIQGDVGSGKTVVGILSGIQAINSGFQFAFLAPTDILARQQLMSIRNMFEKTIYKGDILTSKEKGKARKKILENLQSGEINYIVGTHALFEDNVIFKNLGLVIVDEQHRFGVNQRIKLIQKGDRPNILSMTATPIPRTLLMTLYGDMDVSVISDKPSGRKDIKTTVMSNKKIKDLINSLSRPISKGEKVYWVCPLVEESEKIDLMNATDRFKSINDFYNGKVALLHGKLKAQEKQDIMESFKNGSIDILVSTTVIEVGVDVSDATVMIIEHAERFGLSQLHQLRGRVGRNDKQSSCILVYGDNLSPVSKKRLDAMRDNCDGFSLADIDLKLRGGGDLLGTKQSGSLEFKLMREDDEENISEILIFANKVAKEVLKEKNYFKIKLLLSIFDRHDAIEYMKSG